MGAAKAGACLGTFLGGAAMYKYGRVRTVGGSGAFFVAGPALMASARGIAQLVVGRLVIGLGIGISAVVIPAYLAEMAPARLRGALVITYEGLLCIGMLMSIITDATLEVRCRRFAAPRWQHSWSRALMQQAGVHGCQCVCAAKRACAGPFALTGSCCDAGHTRQLALDDGLAHRASLALLTGTLDPARVAAVARDAGRP